VGSDAGLFEVSGGGSDLRFTVRFDGPVGVLLDGGSFYGEVMPLGGYPTLEVLVQGDDGKDVRLEAILVLDSSSMLSDPTLGSRYEVYQDVLDFGLMLPAGLSGRIHIEGINLNGGRIVSNVNGFDIDADLGLSAANLPVTAGSYIYGRDDIDLLASTVAGAGWVGSSDNDLIVL
jgi:hypothetical protein